MPVGNQPWFNQWMRHDAPVIEDSTIRLSILLNTETGGRDEDRLREVMGHQWAQEITTEHPLMEARTLPSQDTLVWTRSRKGKYSVKEGYQCLRSDSPEVQLGGDPYWEAIWNNKEVIPKVKLFLWRAGHGGLPVAQELHRRIRSIDPICGRCHMENEFLTHMLFFCQASRMAWFVSDISLSVEDLPLTLKEAVLKIMARIPTSKVPYYFNLMWCIWKSRNEQVIEGTRVSPRRAVFEAASMEKVKGGRTAELVAGVGKQGECQYEIPWQFWTILVDASWDTNGRAGMGMVEYDASGNIAEVQYRGIQAEDALQAEVKAALHTIKHVADNRRGEHVILFTDCRNLVKSIAERAPEDAVTWRSTGLIDEIIRRLDEVQPRTEVKHVSRHATLRPITWLI